MRTRLPFVLLPRPPSTTRRAHGVGARDSPTTGGCHCAVWGGAAVAGVQRHGAAAGGEEPQVPAVGGWMGMKGGRWRVAAEDLTLCCRRAVAAAATARCGGARRLARPTSTAVVYAGRCGGGARPPSADGGNPSPPDAPQPRDAEFKGHARREPGRLSRTRTRLRALVGAVDAGERDAAAVWTRARRRQWRRRAGGQPASGVPTDNTHGGVATAPLAASRRFLFLLSLRVLVCLSGERCAPHLNEFGWYSRCLKKPAP
eukprot:TRINITY_DN850_c0_g1_i6.p2 TRINITY_DN850_c0_g1~~TRINITY_DN850_c0_g1_i6.p2  ORF type:complete len:258 (+),score=29.70 TRINITY_DN850_c0_g1_i6:1070-1843(+)